jgi:hypothetical protein
MQAGLLACGLCLATVGLAAEPIPTDQLDRLISVIKPTADEDKWTNIPWQINLWEARKVAAKEGKPILLWEMDGHPLGCT